MRMRPAPLYENGLAVTPRKRGCVGESCPVAERIGRCFTDRHHLYYSEALYNANGELYARLRDDDNASVWVARCRHNSGYKDAWHNLYDYTPLPSKDIVHRFLQESQLLTNLGLSVKYMSKTLSLFSPQSEKERRRLAQEEVFEKRVEFFQENMYLYEEYLTCQDEFEVMPQAVVGRCLTELGSRRRQLVATAEAVTGIVFDMPANKAA